MAKANSGRRSLLAGILDEGDNQASYSTALQTISIPENPDDQTLHVRLYTASSEETPMSLPADPLTSVERNKVDDSDRQMVLLLGLDGRVIDTLFMDRLNDATWKAYSFDLSDHAGEQVKLYFGVANNGKDGVTSMYVDDASLGRCEVVPTPSATPETPPDMPYKNYAPVVGSAYP